MTPAIVPASRPGISNDEARSILRKNGVEISIALLGIRGYYLDTMGVPGANDRGIYDDCIVLVTSPQAFTFNANTDPSVGRPGIAVLRCGLYVYRLGIHGLNKPVERQYEALVQAAKVTVDRDGGKSETGMFGINIHRGSMRSTSSLGCQTIYPPQWPEFIKRVKSELAAAKQTRLPYLLIDEQTRKA